MIPPQKIINIDYKRWMKEENIDPSIGEIEILRQFNDDLEKKLRERIQFYSEYYKKNNDYEGYYDDSYKGNYNECMATLVVMLSVIVVIMMFILGKYTYPNLI